MQPSICRLTPVFGAKITNIDLSQKLNRGMIDILREAFEENSLLFFPKQFITDEAHIAFTEYFGVSERPRKNFGSYHHRPNINVVINYDKEGNLYKANEPRARFRKGQRMWHTDGSYKSIPSIASILRACIVPPEGGHTQFATPSELLGMDCPKRTRSVFKIEQPFITTHILVAT